MSKRYRYLYINENWEVAQGDSVHPRSTDFKSGGAVMVFDMRHGKQKSGGEWEKIKVDNESESSD